LILDLFIFALEPWSIWGALKILESTIVFRRFF
jgi:hypothetical protein